MIDNAVGPVRPALRVALGGRGYDSIRHALATEPIDTMMAPAVGSGIQRQPERHHA